MQLSPSRTTVISRKGSCMLRPLYAGVSRGVPTCDVGNTSNFGGGRAQTRLAATARELRRRRERLQIVSHVVATAGQPDNELNVRIACENCQILVRDPRMCCKT